MLRRFLRYLFPAMTHNWCVWQVNGRWRIDYVRYNNGNPGRPVKPGQPYVTCESYSHALDLVRNLIADYRPLKPWSEIP